MNQLILVVVALVALCYFGGNYCPAVLKNNKKMLLGVVVGLVLCSFFGMRLEGMVEGPSLGDQFAASGKEWRAEGKSGRPSRDLYTDH